VLDKDCEWTQINASPDHCEFIKMYCDGNSLINFYHIYYCTMKENNIYFVPMAVRY
jgi:hypothetical protein